MNNKIDELEKSVNKIDEIDEKYMNTISEATESNIRFASEEIADLSISSDTTADTSDYILMNGCFIWVDVESGELNTECIPNSCSFDYDYQTGKYDKIQYKNCKKVFDNFEKKYKEKYPKKTSKIRSNNNE